MDYGRDIENVDIAVSITEINSDEVKLSFRSKHDDVDVGALAELFDGRVIKRHLVLY